MNIYHEIIKPDYTIKYREVFTWTMLHWHQRLELLLIEKGCFHITLRGQVYEAAAGDVIVIPSGAIHSLQKVSDEGAMYICTFAPSILHTLQSAVPVVQSHISQNALEQAGIYGQICGHFSQMYKEFWEEEQYAELSVPARIQLVFSLLARNFAGETDSTSMESYPAFQEVLSYISDNFHQQITLSDIAKQLNYSPSYVSGMFVTCTGVNFKAYLDSIRIHEAVRMLRSTNETVASISAACGFENIRTFNNAFRRITGTTPRDFRKNT